MDLFKKIVSLMAGLASSLIFMFLSACGASSSEYSAQQASCIAAISMSTGEKASWEVTKSNNQPYVIELEKVENNKILLYRKINDVVERITLSYQKDNQRPHYVASSPINSAERYLVTGNMPIDATARDFLGIATAQTKIQSHVDDIPQKDSYFSTNKCNMSMLANASVVRTCSGNADLYQKRFQWQESKYQEQPKPGIGIKHFVLTYSNQELINIKLIGWNNL